MRKIDDGKKKEKKGKKRRKKRKKKKKRKKEKKRKKNGVGYRVAAQLKSYSFSKNKYRSVQELRSSRTFCMYFKLNFI